MEMQGSRALAITQQQAWDALNNPQVLKTCIPGCDKVEPTGDNQYAVGVAVKIGPVSAKFNGKITLSEINPPNSYTITFDGQGGAAGFGKGNSQVTLSPPEEGQGCVLSYSVHASVGGKIAQMGQRLIDGVAKSMAEDFFKRFDDEMQRQYPGAYAAAAATPAVAPAAAGAGGAGKIPVWAWVAGAVVVLAAIWLLR
jgi:carbon monoxide dehydrogenase subunit G